jgi:uncharacterized repeat protein (TIGR01451 family)
LPTRQCRALIFELAVPSFAPITFGTTHGGLNGGGGGAGGGGGGGGGGGTPTAAANPAVLLLGADIVVSGPLVSGRPQPADGAADVVVTARRAQVVKSPRATQARSAAAPITKGSTVTLTYVVTNNGPQPATNVVLSEQLGIGLVFVSSSATQGSCTGTGPVVCALGDLAAGASATVTITARAIATGLLDATSAVNASETDANLNNNNANTTVPVALPPATLPPPIPPAEPILPAPVPGSLVNAQPTSGTVLVDGVPFTTPAQLRVGALIDVRGGSIELITQNDVAVFSGGIFRIQQSSNPNAATELVLVPAVNRSVCGKTAKRSTQMALRPKVLGLLLGNGKGKFRTRARYSSATVRGTIWLVAERCDGSFTSVRSGMVAVFDQTLKKTIIVTRGHSYLARPPRK